MIAPAGKKYEGGKWLDKYEAKLDICPVFIRQGAIIPMYPDMNYVGEKPADVLTLDLYPYGNTSFNLYEDDGLTRDYKKGEFARTLISVSSPKGEKGTITVDIAKANLLFHILLICLPDNLPFTHMANYP